MPSFVAAAAVTYTFDGETNSASRTIPAAAAVFFACTLWHGTSPTIAATIAAAAPTESYQGFEAGQDVRNYLAVFVGAPSGAQTVFVGTSDFSVDSWSCGFRGVDGIDTVDPFDGQVTDTASPDSISVTTTADGLAVGVQCGSNPDLGTSDTEVLEGPVDSNGATMVAVASAPGTGGAVSLDWTTVTSLIQLAIAVNLRHAAAAGGGPMFRGS